MDYPIRAKRIDYDQIEMPQLKESFNESQPNSSE